MSVNFNIIHPPVNSLLAVACNLMRSTARWIQDPETKLLSKIATVALAIFALFITGVSLAPIDLLLCASVAALFCTFGFALERIAKDFQSVTHFGIVQLLLPNRRQLPPPTLRPPLTIKANGCICVGPQAFQSHHHFSMKGYDQYDRPLIVMRIERDQNPTVGTLILHQRYTTESEWTYSTYFGENDFHSFDLTEDALGELRQIVDGTHPTYRAAPSI